MVVVVAVCDMVICGVIVGGTVVRELIVGFCDPPAGGSSGWLTEGSSGWSTSIGVIGRSVGPTPKPSGTGLIVYHLLASSTAMYTQRRSSSM